jgi:chromosome segregation ATPase
VRARKNPIASPDSPIKRQKDTFQKSANYLRSTLKDTERTLEETKTRLTDREEQAEQDQSTYQATLSQKDQELTKKQENYKLIQERNTELQAKLAASQEENSKLTEWISKLEAASVEGDAFQTLQGELAQAKQTIQDLEEQLSAKNPRKNYLWLYALLALIALYFLMN